MHAVARAWMLAIPALLGSGALGAQQPTPAKPPTPGNTAEQGKPTTNPKAPPAAQVAPRTRADTARALREPLDTVRVDAQPAGKPPAELAVEGGPPWRVSYFPFISGTGGDLLAVARVRPWLPAAFEDRVTYRAAVTFDAGVGIHGSYLGSVRFDAPLLWVNWRLASAAMVTRETRFGYYGFGNNSLYDKALADSTQPNLFRLERKRYLAYADLSRLLIGHLYLAGRGGVERAEFGALDGPSVFASEHGAGLSETDLNGRIALVWDSRANEYNPRTGLLVEAGFQAGNGGDGYTRVYGLARGFVPLRPSTVLAARIGASDLHGTPSFDARFELPTWELPLPVYGGYTSNRGFAAGRFVGSGVVFGSLELRQDFLPFGEIASGSVVAFVDAGRVFENETFAVNGQHLHVAVGIGLAARLLRSTIFTGNIARSGEGWRFSAGSGWAF